MFWDFEERLGRKLKSRVNKLLWSEKEKTKFIDEFGIYFVGARRETLNKSEFLKSCPQYFKYGEDYDYVKRLGFCQRFAYLLGWLFFESADTVNYYGFRFALNP